MFLSACSSQSPDYASLGLVDVSGTIKIDGEPVPGAVVAFKDVSNGNESYGLTNSSGYYRLWFNSEKYGVMPGEKQIEFSTTRKILGLNSEEEGGVGEESEAGPPVENSGVEEFHEAYRKDSKIVVTVDDDSSTFDFDLASDGSTSQPL
ncbi:carboxypeptidase-like regulatory domain-containing protein [Thalassoglobus sp. JC818]|uniref:carboxypeptidase-like regulatory domain-containing protein n=1 Tax=Thalassoglobus sp. JC818 TaxID=3232136 RepID=UPI0034591AAE